MKKQIIFIRGGETFANKEDFYTFLRNSEIYNTNKKEIHWRDELIESLSETHEPLVPTMPVRENSDYKAWKIWFERHLDFIYDESPILVGTSLGATFLLKYLSENGFNKKIFQLHLVAPCVNDEEQELEKLFTFEFDVTKINTISDICNDIHLWHSKDDTCVPFSNSEIVKENLPSADFHIFEDKGHFQLESFPEILEVINKTN